MEKTLYNSGLRKGRAEGIEEGRREAVVETARRMKALGLAPDVIAGATGLTADDIEKL